MTIIEKLAASCSTTPTDIKIIGRTGFWTVVEYTLGGVTCQATLLTK